MLAPRQRARPNDPLIGGWLKWAIKLKSQRLVSRRQQECGGMPYGRLDVFWPEGIIRSFPLSEDNVSVGRSSGNTITLENNTISRYHFTIEIGRAHV